MKDNLKKYLIHDNGSRPYKVEASESVIDIYREKEALYPETFEFEMEPFLSTEFEQIFIGESPLCPMTEFSGGHGPEFSGNTILYKTGENSYVHVGGRIRQFSTLSEIVKFVSPVGNNDFPYPYAIERLGYYYLIIGEVALKEPEHSCDLSIFREDPYQHYINLTNITTDKGYIPPREPSIKFEGIESFYIDDEECTLRYHPHPEKDFDRLCEDSENLYITKADESTIKLNKETYVEIMKKYGDMLGFIPVDSKILT